MGQNSARCTKGKAVGASIVNGELRSDGKAFKGLSPAARHYTGYQTNGWTFWVVKRPTDGKFISVDGLRRMK